MSRTLRWAAALAALALAAAALLMLVDRARQRWTPDPRVIASASLEGLREQNRLSTFVADYVAVVTASQSRFGLTARRTLILPGTVRYEVDLARLRPRDLNWHVAARTLDVMLPPVELVGPQIDFARIREYDGGGLLLGLTGAGRTLDQANRAAAQAELLRQARGPVPMALARDATRRAVERSFALPLRAAGLDAKVRVRFVDEPGFRAPNRSEVDRSRSLRDVLGGAR